MNRFILFIVFLSSINSLSIGQTFQMPSIEDSFIGTNNSGPCLSWQTTNNGTYPMIFANHWTWNALGCGAGAHRGMYKFDINPSVTSKMLYDNRAFMHLFFPPGSTETHFYTGSATNNQFYVERINQLWSENTVTWNTQPTTTAVGQVLVPSSTPNPSTQNYIIDISGIALEWICNGAPNYGMMLRMTSETQLYRRVTFTSREWTEASERPYLRLEYAEIAATGPDTVCLSQNFTINCNLTNANNPSVYTYAWTHINSGTNYTTQNVNNPQTVLGLNTYVVTVSNPWCQTAKDTIQVFVAPNAVATINPVSPLCQDDVAFNLTAATVGGTWTGNGITDASLGTFDPLVAGVGTHTITYTISGPCGATATTDIVVNPSPTPSISGTTAICEMQSTMLTASGGDTYLWNTGATGASINMSPINSTTYTVTVTNSNGCSATDSVLVVVHGLPNAAYVATNICEGNDVNFIDATTITPPDNIATYAWTFSSSSPVYNGTSDVQDPLMSFPGAGTYAVHLLVASSFGCTDSIDGVVTIFANPVSDFTYQSQCFLTNVFQQTATPPSGLIYQWDLDGDGTIDETLPSFTYVFPDTSEKWVTLTVIDSNNCVSDTTKLVNVKGGVDNPIMPNVLSVSSSINNKFDFQMFAPGFNECIDYTLSIYNRWGFKVYEAVNNTNNPDLTCMQCFTCQTSNGAPLVPGTYFYVLQGNKGIEIKGAITIFE